ncbi:hypothetical protein [Mycobacteroides franklinii]|uniref:hypothetical protein n=1 Tax=Mycobacteroides franklinii TaxID=948102 RepID=UPI000992EC1F|nr:hypothetical protein [Mycobacteroides franklinii]ORA62123.1 hypothetical protein BST24_08230 [Mycobacteroides franklinii]
MSDQDKGADNSTDKPAKADDESVDYELEAAVAAECTPTRRFVARHATTIVIGVLAVCLAAVTAVAAGLWVENNRTIDEVPQARPTVKLGVPLVNPEVTTASTTTTTKSRARTTSSTTGSTGSTATTTTSGSATTTATTTSISVPGPTTSSVPREATKDEQYELTNVLKAFYAALGAKNLDVLNALSCVKITDEDLEGQSDDLKITVDKVEKTVINGDTASSRVTITATAGGKTQTKSGIAGFARISNRWVTCANQ